MPSLPWQILHHPLEAINFLYYFTVQLLLLTLHRILLPHYPYYQSFRTQVQRAYLASTSLCFPTLTHRLPATYTLQQAARIHGTGWNGYVTPGDQVDRLHSAGDSDDVGIVLYAHGGGYARGEARMYYWHTRRWIEVAKAKGLEVIFVSVEYPLSGKVPHPAQRAAFLAAYHHLLELNIPASKIMFMGDSAGGGLCINAALHALETGVPQPAGSVLISPWLDMSLSAYEGGNQAVMSDFLVAANTAVPVMANAFLGPYAATDPDVNPLCRPLEQIKNLNPQLIFVGGPEFALSDSKDWARLCREAGVKHELHVGWGQLHVWALGLKWIEPSLRRKTEERIVDWMIDCIHRSSMKPS
ncbi:Esterase [Fulvia fulva]|uniref:Esterase n=1 Tax=Passalora fulva TaxID=5499 RepID=A0A9Q8P2R5_PASFU|nr:Esterase [Fulvia fulva]KAK4636479.1 Esterase [Fulvia fulva]UJO11220.1 Esterase [Fulvia fulva]WPV25327.1 Esterase [Fulvia fulva]